MLDSDAGGKLGGSEYGEFDWNTWYKILLIPILFFRIAQMFFSIIIFLLGLFFDYDQHGTIFTIISWSIIDKCNLFCLELGTIFRWLIWLTSYFSILIIQPLFTTPFAVVYSVYGISAASCSSSKYKSQRRMMRQFTFYDQVFDRRLLILSAVMINEDQSLFFCNPIRDAYFTFPTWTYTSWTLFHRIWYTLEYY